MLKGILVSTLFAVTSLAGLADQANVNWPDCYCTDTSGARVELGETVCLTVDGRTYKARCEMMLNNPMWREIGSSCAVSQQRVLPNGPGSGVQSPLSANG